MPENQTNLIVDDPPPGGEGAGDRNGGGEGDSNGAASSAVNAASDFLRKVGAIQTDLLVQNEALNAELERVKSDLMKAELSLFNVRKERDDALAKAAEGCPHDDPLRTAKDHEWALAQMPPPLPVNGQDG